MSERKRKNLTGATKI